MKDFRKETRGNFSRIENPNVDYHTAIRNFKQSQNAPIAYRETQDRSRAALSATPNYKDGGNRKKAVYASGVFDFKKNPDKPVNQIPEKDEEPEIVDLPVTFQKQLIDSIVR